MQNRIYKVDHTDYINTLSFYLKTNGILKIPTNIDILKTCPAKETAPLNPDWLYVRAASIYRKVLIASFKNEKLSITRLSSVYGCKKDRGSRPGKKVRASKGYLISVVNDFVRIGWIDKERKIRDEGLKFSKQVIENLIKLF